MVLWCQAQQYMLLHCAVIALFVCTVTFCRQDMKSTTTRLLGKCMLSLHPHLEHLSILIRHCVTWHYAADIRYYMHLQGVQTFQVTVHKAAMHQSNAGWAASTSPREVQLLLHGSRASSTPLALSNTTSVVMGVRVFSEADQPDVFQVGLLGDLTLCSSYGISGYVWHLMDFIGISRTQLVGAHACPPWC